MLEIRLKHNSENSLNVSENVTHHQKELEKRIFHLKTLYDVSQEISFLKDPHEIVKNLLLMVVGTFGACSGFLVLVDTNERKAGNYSLRAMPGDFAHFLGTENTVDFFVALQKITKISKPTAENPDAPHGDCVRAFGAAGLKILIPFAINENLLGCIGLGEKLSGQEFSSDDCELLDTLARQGAMAIQNAILVQQMKKEENVRTNLARYLSPQIVEKIIHHDLEVNLGGERKVVTVLFSDIRQFTSITESIPPEQLIHILNEYFTELVRIIFKHRGSIDKFIGDAVVAVFGSLIKTNSHAEKAVCAAAEMMQAMRMLNKRWFERYDGFTMEMGIGINTGKAFLGNIGSPERMEFTVMGDIVNVAARLSSDAKAGQILISEATKQEVNNAALQCQLLPPMHLKGKSHSMTVYQCFHRRSQDPLCARPPKT